VTGRTKVSHSTKSEVEVRGRREETKRVESGIKSGVFPAGGIDYRGGKT